MKILITEAQLNLIQKELGEEYPSSWNVDEFKKLRSFNQRIQYCQNNLVRLSSGSSRIVYKIDETKVLKLAKNNKGLAQNEVEIDYGRDYMWDGITAEVFEYDDNNLWLEMELARKLTPNEFKRIVGVTFEEFVQTIRYYENEQKPKSRYYNPSKPDNYDDMWENEFVYRILDVIGSYGVPAGDLTRLSTYGIVNRENQDHVVMVDFGLTNDVYDSYYKK